MKYGSCLNRALKRHDSNKIRILHGISIYANSYIRVPGVVGVRHGTFFIVNPEFLSHGFIQSATVYVEKATNIDFL